VTPRRLEGLSSTPLGGDLAEPDHDRLGSFLQQLRDFLHDDVVRAIDLISGRVRKVAKETIRKLRIWGSGARIFSGAPFYARARHDALEQTASWRGVVG